MATSVYEVKASQIYCFNSKVKTVAARAGTLKKGERFKAEGPGREEWYQIVTNPHKGKYVQRSVSAVSGDGSFNRVISATEKENAANQTTEAKTTTDAVTGEQRPESTDANGNTTQETSPVDAFQASMDDEFMEEYSSYSGNYASKISGGLTIDNLRGVLGIPHQFLPSTDPRIDGSDKQSSLGRVYTEKILRYMPLLLITPGIPSFMSGFSQEQKAGLLESLITGIAQAVTVENIEADGYSGKYYSLKYAYVDYFKYVNGMLRSAALFLGIQDVKIDGKRLGEFNWLYRDDGGTNATSSSGIGKFLGPYAGAVAFYADCGTSINDSFSNSTTQSQLASTLNSLSDTGRELNFLIGNVGSLAGIQLTQFTGMEDLQDNMATVRDAVNKTLNTSNVMSNILNKAQTILAGGRIVFPEIWSDSSFGRSYSCQMKLVAPAGDKLSIYLNILVPIYHLLAMCLPRQSIQQSYFSPFLLRCYYKGLFNVDMGIMTGLSITKGAEAEWSYDGIPTVADVSFEIKDLYEGMFMSYADGIASYNLLSNITELDYIANSCGININDQEIMRTAKLAKLLMIDNSINDYVYTDIFGGVMQFFNQKMQSLFGVF